MTDWSDEETEDPLYADRRNFYKVQKWSRDGLRVESHALCWQQPRQSAPRLRANGQAAAAHPPHDPPAHAGVGRVATGRNVALTLQCSPCGQRQDEATLLRKLAQGTIAAKAFDESLTFN
jgi:hypothetical protein